MRQLNLGSPRIPALDRDFPYQLLIRPCPAIIAILAHDNSHVPRLSSPLVPLTARAPDLGKHIVSYDRVPETPFSLWGTVRCHRDSATGAPSASVPQLRESTVRTSHVLSSVTHLSERDQCTAYSIPHNVSLILGCASDILNFHS